MEEKKKKLFKIDDLPKNVIQDPTAPPDLIVLWGFVGESSKENYVRLYLTPELNDFVEIPEENCKHQEECPKEQNPLGGSYLWIDRDAELFHQRIESKTVQADFLQGEISQRYISGAPPEEVVGGLRPECLGDTMDYCLYPTDFCRYPTPDVCRYPTPCNFYSCAGWPKTVCVYPSCINFTCAYPTIRTRRWVCFNNSRDRICL